MSQKLWEASLFNKNKSNLLNFEKFISKRFNYKPSKNYNKLFNWSIKYPKYFWSSVWDYTNVKGKKSDNKIINDKVYFINQLTNLRELKMNYQFIKSDKNIATKHLFTKEDTAGRDSKGYV